MRQTDVAIIGGGLAGSTCAAMLGRAGIDAILIDPHESYPQDFRCEKFDASQVAALGRTGLADIVLPTTAAIDELWVARFGHLVEKRPNDQFGFQYHALVNTMRGAIPASVPVIAAKAAGVSLGANRQSITLSNGEEISARLVVMANGLNTAIRRNLGMDATVISSCHSISIGFDLKPTGRTRFDFTALTYFGEHPGDRVSYLSLFPTGPSMRANLFVYRSMDDPWLRELRNAPQATLFATLPRLKRLIGDFEVTDVVKIRPVDLYETTGYLQNGIVLVGDALATSCPAAGTGTNKVLTDVERLCNEHIPDWLTTPGMARAKVESFYRDPVKQESDAHSKAKAFHLRSLTLETGLVWRAQRWARFGQRLAAGALRNVRQQLPSRSPALRQTAAAAKSGQ